MPTNASTTSTARSTLITCSAVKTSTRVSRKANSAACHCSRNPTRGTSSSRATTARFPSGILRSVRSAIDARLRARALGLEAIAYIADRLNVRGTMRVDLNLGAQSRDASIHAAIVDNNFVTPDTIKDLVSRKGATRSRDKKSQKLEFLGRKRNFHFAAEQLVCGKVEFACAERKRSS